jgi:hypothetical protein
LFNFIFEVDTFIGNAKKNRTGDNTAKQNNNGLPIPPQETTKLVHSNTTKK